MELQCGTNRALTLTSCVKSIPSDHMMSMSKVQYWYIADEDTCKRGGTPFLQTFHAAQCHLTTSISFSHHYLLSERWASPPGPLTQTLSCWWTCCTTWGTRPTCQGTRIRCTPNESMSKSQDSRRTSLKTGLYNLQPPSFTLAFVPISSFPLQVLSLVLYDTKQRQPPSNVAALRVR
jgi:hypothetical protein